MNRRTFLAALPLWSQFRSTLLTDEPPVAVVRYPYLQNVQSERATIMWASLDPGVGIVQYSPDGVSVFMRRAMARTFPPEATGLTHPFTQYEAAVTGLTPKTTYAYRTFIDGTPINDGQIRTAGPGDFSFIVFGDSGQGTSDQYYLAVRMIAERPSMVIHTGDVAYFNGTFSQYDRYYFSYYQSLMASVPFFLTPGNHDCETNNAGPFLSLHSFPMDNVPFADRGRYYSFDWGNVHFVAIDSSLSLDAAVNRNGPMLQWLENDLRSTKQFWRVAIIHHAPYSTGPNEQEVRAFWARTYVVPILEAYGVQVTFSGEEHSYQRSYSLWQGRVVPEGSGIVYFTTGGGGATLYPVDLSNPRVAFGRSEHHYLRVEVNGMRMAVRAIRQDGSEIDRFIVSPRPIFARDTATGEAVMFYLTPGGRTLMRIWGHSLASEELVAQTLPLPKELGGTAVLVNGQAAGLTYVANNQIYAEGPSTLTDPLTVKVITPNGSAETFVSPHF